jgi:hypothetical protein
MPDEVGHHHLVHSRHNARLRQRQPTDGAYELLELARRTALDGPVAWSATHATPHALSLAQGRGEGRSGRAHLNCADAVPVR